MRGRREPGVDVECFTRLFAADKGLRDMTTGLQDTGRADARRNRAKVLAVAAEAFAEHGLEVPLAEIARRAGVGVGTVHRNFPSKQTLLEAVLVLHVDDLVAAAGRWAEQAPPTAAFFGFLHEVVDKSHRRKHVCAAVTRETGWPHPELRAAAGRFHAALSALLRAAQQSGGVRTDVGLHDVTALAVGSTSLRAAHRDPVGGIRMAQLALECLRAPGDVTEPTGFRDRFGGLGTTPCCEVCGVRIEARHSGRPARYCGATCRQRAHRRRVGR